MTTLIQIETEAKRRVDEDYELGLFCPRIIYVTTGGKLKIWPFYEKEELEAYDEPISIVWKDKVEIL
ncbi:MAG TPA: hypothetical protein ENH82_09665 [bacterium]|nr:hypothetical protein [bacterium]